MKNICAVTGTRAEYGLLKPLLKRIKEDDELKLQLVVTGMHLSPEFGLTYQEIEADGFQISEKNEMLLSSDTPNGITKSSGLGMIGFADIFTRLRPDMVVLLGDRYEIFSAAAAALIHRIPIAHIHGGELTEGAIDDAMRHAITKMSMLHFASTEEYRRRIIQMGEQPENVFNVGGLGVENIKSQKLLSKEDLEESMGFVLDVPYILVTYHSVTLENNTAKEQCENLLAALSEKKEYKLLFTKANSDTDGRIINALIEDYVEAHKERVHVVTSLGMQRYLSAVKYCSMVVGNSSSGLLEVPSFHIPTVNIGDRQKGRIQAESVINCRYGKEDILAAIECAEKWNVDYKNRRIVNPYEGQNTSLRIINEIKKYLASNTGISKEFYNLKDDFNEIEN